MEPMLRRLAFILPAVLLVPLAACGDDDNSTGAACEVPDDCYTDLSDDNRDAIPGEIECLENVEGGYCTHQCESDDDCCSVDGECDHREVCSPFENESAIKRCFLACEDTDVGDQDATQYCQDFASDEFTCRSTGGGDQNRQVCLPGGA
jgi:hypothetical protein